MSSDSDGELDSLVTKLLIDHKDSDVSWVAMNAWGGTPQSPGLVRPKPYAKYKAAHTKLKTLIKGYTATLQRQAELGVLKTVDQKVIGKDEIGGYARGVQPIRNKLRAQQRQVLAALKEQSK